MNRNYWRGFIALLWFALPVMALRYWLVWDRLPVRVASHFDAAGNANGWMSREQSLVFTLGFLVFMVTVSSVILYAIHRNYPISTLSWGLVAFFHIEIWTIVVLLDSTLRYNLDGSPISVAPLLLITPVAILGVIGIGFAEKRGAALPPTDVLAEEVHAGRLWGTIFAIPLLAAGSVVAVVPNLTMRFGAALLGLLFIGVFAMAWDGFHYYFTRHGLEIRTLGFRLKSIPGGQIRQYGVESWNPMMGYGIRGLGNHKAYVWGNRGVRVHMDDGEVFLGHSNPQRIVHDLDLVKQFAH
jgi:hypothetical protein